MNLSATFLPMAVFCPSYTAPIPPRPSSRTTRHLPPTTSPGTTSRAALAGSMPLQRIKSAASPSHPRSRRVPAFACAPSKRRRSGARGLGVLVGGLGQTALGPGGQLGMNYAFGGGAVDGLDGGGERRGHIGGFSGADGRAGLLEGRSDGALDAAISFGA